MRRDVEWLLERNPIAAARLHEAVIALEAATVLQRRGDDLLATVIHAGVRSSDDRSREAR